MQLGHTVDGERICRHDLFAAPTLALRQDDISRSRLLASRRRAGPCIVVIGQVLAVVGKVFLDEVRPRDVGQVHEEQVRQVLDLLCPVSRQ